MSGLVGGYFRAEVIELFGKAVNGGQDLIEFSSSSFLVANSFKSSFVASLLNCRGVRGIQDAMVNN